MIATWHVLRFEEPTESVPWRPLEAMYWQVGPSAGARIAMVDPRYWSFLGTWPDEATARAAEAALSAQTAAVEAWHLHLRPVSGHGDTTLVDGANPFADLPRAAAVDGPVAILTVGVVPQDPATLQTFFGAAFGPVAQSLAAEPGCLAQSNQRAAEIDGLAAFTFTVWDELRSATGWAYRPGPHRTMLDRSATEALMETSGFWRFAVLSSHGTVDGHDPLAGLQPPTPSPADRASRDTDSVAASARFEGNPRMDSMTALDASTARVLELVGEVDHSQWTKPTPCPEWNVRALVGHLLAGMLGYTRLLHGASAAELQALLQQQAVLGGDDLLTAVTDAADQVRAAFAEPGALERTVHHPMGDLPGSRLLQMRIGDNVIHGWDLATALGLPATIDDALAEYVYQDLAPAAERLPATGYFAPPRRVLAADAGPQERLLMLVGR